MLHVKLDTGFNIEVEFTIPAFYKRFLAWGIDLLIMIAYYVIVSQLSYFVVTRLATGKVAFTTYSNAYQLFQLPHAIIAVSVITALLPRMSSHAADARLDLVRGDLSLGLRMSAVVLVPGWETRGETSGEAG